MSALLINSSIIIKCFIISICAHCILTHNDRSFTFELKRSQEKPLRYLESDYQYEMRNFNKMQYFIEIPVGSQKQPMQFLIDTGSSVNRHLLFLNLQVVWTAVQECEECENNKFRQSESATFERLSWIRDRLYVRKIYLQSMHVVWNG